MATLATLAERAEAIRKKKARVALDLRRAVSEIDRGLQRTRELVLQLGALQRDSDALLTEALKGVHNAER